MSAFIVSNLHINTIAHYADVHGFGPAEHIAKTLYRENVRSVNYRYREKTRTSFKSFAPADITRLSPADIVKLCDCLDYQSDQRPDYKDSEACAYLNGIRSYAAQKTTSARIEQCRTWSI